MLNYKQLINTCKFSVKISHKPKRLLWLFRIQTDSLAKEN